MRLYIGIRLARHIYIQLAPINKPQDHQHILIYYSEAKAKDNLQHWCGYLP